MGKKKECVRCHKQYNQTKRGLCWRCYRNPAARHSHPRLNTGKEDDMTLPELESMIEQRYTTAPTWFHEENQANGEVDEFTPRHGVGVLKFYRSIPQKFR